MKIYAWSPQKWLLTLIGARFSDHALLQLQAFVNYLRIGRWMYNHGLFFPDRVLSREDVWAAMITKVRDRKVLYTEFGVAHGASIRYCSRELKNPASALHGFDSFEGLPEYAGPWYKGQFDASGNVPIIDDSRVSFLRDGSTKCSPVISFPHTMCLLSTWTPTFTRLRYTH